MNPPSPQPEQQLRPLVSGELERDIERAIDLAISGRYEDLTAHALRVEQRLSQAALAIKLDPAAGPEARGAVEGLVAQSQALEDVMAYAASVHRILHDVAKSAETGYGPAGTADKGIVTRGAHITGEA